MGSGIVLGVGEDFVSELTTYVHLVMYVYVVMWGSSAAHCVFMCVWQCRARINMCMWDRGSRWDPRGRRQVGVSGRVYVYIYVCVPMWGYPRVLCMFRCVHDTACFSFACLCGVLGVSGTLSGALRTV